MRRDSDTRSTLILLGEDDSTRTDQLDPDVCVKEKVPGTPPDGFSSL